MDDISHLLSAWLRDLGGWSVSGVLVAGRLASLLQCIILTHKCTQCLLSESVLEPLYIVNDVFCKNIFGLLMWSTLWGLNQGNWNSTFEVGSVAYSLQA